jgi:type IV fimbrial biogenesis protein FimT
MRGLKFSRGATLIEMMIGVAILAILMTLAVPNFSLWIKNLGIRSAAESIRAGLMLARTEAMKKNTAMRFHLTTSVGAECALYDNEGGSAWAWIVSRDDAVTNHQCGAAASETDAPRIVQTYDGRQSGGDKVRLAAGQSLFTFNGLGRLTSAAADILVADAGGEENCASKGGRARCLNIKITTGGIRMCDPALPGTDTQACG